MFCEKNEFMNCKSIMLLFLYDEVGVGTYSVFERVICTSAWLIDRFLRLFFYSIPIINSVIKCAPQAIWKWTIFTNYGDALHVTFWNGFSNATVCACVVNSLCHLSANRLALPMASSGSTDNISMSESLASSTVSGRSSTLKLPLRRKDSHRTSASSPETNRHMKVRFEVHSQYV
jgi:hypothetical protein